MNATLHVVVLYSLISLLFAYGFDAWMKEEDRSNPWFVFGVVIFCMFWPLIPLLVKIIKWDTERMESRIKKRGRHE